jgi:hypothetical protein
MPRSKLTLPFGFTSLAPFNISDDQWKKIETRSGFAIPPDLRSTVVARTRTMCWRSEAWQSALPIRETVRQIAGIKRATVDWLDRIDGLPPEVEGMVMSVDDCERADLGIKPFMKFLVASCEDRLAELALIEAQDARHPWENWIVQVTELFEQYGLATGARKDVDKNKAGPSPFVIVIRELQQLIEPQYRRSILSDDALSALSDAISRARSSRDGQITPVEQTCQDKQAESDQVRFGGQTENPTPE